MGAIGTQTRVLVRPAEDGTRVGVGSSLVRSVRRALHEQGFWWDLAEDVIRVDVCMVARCRVHKFY